MGMSKKFVVINTKEECPTMDEKEEVFELFGLPKTAFARAERAAKGDPGTVFMVCEAIAEVKCDVGKPTTRRLRN